MSFIAYQYMMRMSALVETYMTSVERLSHYAKRLESEETVLARALVPPTTTTTTEDDGQRRAGLSSLSSSSSSYSSLSSSSSSSSSSSLVQPTVNSNPLIANDNDDWTPSAGKVELVNLRVRYRCDLPEVVTGVTATMDPGSKVGVVGRTGSGKSSLLLALSRLNEVSE